MTKKSNFSEEEYFSEDNGNSWVSNNNLKQQNIVQEKEYISQDIVQNKKRVGDRKGPNNALYKIIVPFTKEVEINYIEKLVQIPGMVNRFKE